MKTTSITVERNFHIMNEDRFIMEKISMTAELDGTEIVPDAVDRLRDLIEKNFKAAYPKVYTHLNFDEVRQVRDLDKCLKEVSDRQQQKIFNPTERPPSPLTTEKLPSINNEQLKNIIEQSGEPLYKKYDEHPTEKIQKGTIEEQIEACTKLSELLEWRLLAESTKSLKPIYEKRYFELESISKLQTT